MEHWLGRSNPHDLLNVDIVFDARTVHGDPAMFHGLMEKFTAAASDNAAFLKLMIASHPDISPPVSFFGALKGDDEGRLDLKKHLISRVVAAARVLAIRHRQQKRATIERLAAIQSLDLGPLASLDDLAQAYARAQGLVLGSQLASIAKGRQPDNRVVLSELASLERARLKDDLSSIANLGEVVRSAVF
jgi:signal-transduction protein with cAMP-binding, CBS, and nucleotidyltransferase domain